MHLNPPQSMVTLHPVMLNGWIGTSPAGPPAVILAIYATEVGRAPVAILWENIRSVELQKEAILVDTARGLVTLDISDFQYSERDMEALKRFMPCLRRMNRDGTVTLKSYDVECDICSASGAGTIVPARAFAAAVRQGFDPFRNGRVPETLRQGAAPDAAERWALSATDGDSSRSDWNVCGACMTTLSPYLSRGTRGAAAAKKPWWRFWK